MKPAGNYILYLSTYPPRECGIATFTQDLANAFDQRFNPKTKSKIVALNETQSNFYNYPPRVLEAIGANHLENYVDLAERVNKNPNIKLVNVQHEFGIFGGEQGDYLVPFLQAVKKPVVTTFHSVLADPDDELKRVVQLVAGRSKAMVVMNERSKNVLEKDYSIPRSKIHLVPHGIPSVSFEPPKDAKGELGLSGKIVLSTFGMISRDKGIEYAIRSLPKIVKKYPQTVYLVLGATHPVVRREEGEVYRNFLQKEVERLNLKGHVFFYNKYLSLEEIIKYLKATDVYISVINNPMQSVSGTLSYALGCGRAVVSTPTEYAQHVVTGENGMLVKFKNAGSITKALDRILSDDKLLRNMQKNAYETTRHMTWANVAGSYFNIYNKFSDIKREENKFPDITLEHLERLTDSFGLIHHARFNKPERRFGYSIDDNVRALLVCAERYGQEPLPRLLTLMRTYLDFIRFSQQPNGSFAQIVTSQHQKKSFRDEDVQGRGIWALGFVASRKYLPPEITKNADALFKKALGKLSGITQPRAGAFAMTGLYYYLKSCPNDRMMKDFIKLADRQVDLFSNGSSAEWPWFEDHLTYSNSKLSESLFYAYDLTKNKKYLNVAETSLSFLTKVTYEPKHYSPIGQNGWYFRYQKRAYYDQQPEDTASMVGTKLVAYKTTGKKMFLDDALKAFQWFLGKNHLELMVYNEATGGCFDGVGKYALNLNQGAESTLSYLMARIAFEEPEIKKAIQQI
ncbi:glycosyltransferase family 4 protein [Candidatus Giovannonibacteria bacterium]|nr:glycosyltransferase family 4 protein [Candidatus Giovannonibacteria bacterium]